MAKKAPAKPKRRGRPLREEDDGVLHFVTTRVVEERYWLHPLLAGHAKPRNRRAVRMLASLERHRDKRLTAMVRRANERRGPHQPELTLEAARDLADNAAGAALALAQQKHGTIVYAVVVMSNHIHLLVRTRGKNLAAFMRDFKAELSRTINRLTGRSGTLYQRRYDAEPVVDDGAAADRVAYTVNNPCAANLVETPEDWPGLNLAYGLGECRPEITFKSLSLSKWRAAGRPLDLRPFFVPVTLTLSPLPSCEGLSWEACSKSLETWIAQRRAKDAAKQREADDRAEASGAKRRSRPRRALGVKKVIETAFEARPRRPKHSRRPYLHCSVQSRQLEIIQARVSKAQAHQEASEKYLRGEDRNVVFPEGMYPPPLIQAA